MWLNVSAICWNEKLKAKTIQLQREDDPLHINYISEIEETEMIRNSKDKYELVLSDQTNQLLARQRNYIPMSDEPELSADMVQNKELLGMLDE